MKNAITDRLFEFLDASPSPFHAAAALRERLLAAGCEELFENEVWALSPGRRYFVTRNGSSVLAFAVPEEFCGVQFIAAHSDSPTFRVKHGAEIRKENRYTKLNVERYGGMLPESWMDRPLSLAGRVVLRTADGVEAKLFHADRDLLIIPRLAPHLTRGTEPQKPNPQVDLLPLFGDETADLYGYLAEALGAVKEDVLSADLTLCVRQKAAYLGPKDEFICAPRFDDLQCAFSAVEALLAAQNPKKLLVAAVFDNEEVGSTTKQGANGTFLEDTLDRVREALGVSREAFLRGLADSFMLSADNAHAVHPNYAEKYDETNRTYLNGGVVIKYSANQSYTTDAVTAAVFSEICRRAGVPVQVFHNRSDIPGGGTLGNISNTHLSMPSVDIGVPQLAMHASVETAGAADTAHTVDAMTAFFNADIRKTESGFRF